MTSDLGAYALQGDGARPSANTIFGPATFGLGPDGQVVAWSASAKLLYGFTAREIVGHPLSTVHPPVPPSGEQSFEIAARAGRYEGEWELVRRDGTRASAHLVIEPVLTADDLPAGYSVISRALPGEDALDTLPTAEDQFRRLIEGVTDYAIYMLDPHGRVANWNTGAQRIKGYAPAEIVGEHFSRFYTPEDRHSGEPARALETAARVGRFEKEGWRVRRDGTRFWAHVVIDAIREHGELVGFAKITRDITERLAAQKALEEARERLLQSQKLEAVGQLTGGVAHDFNNLLTAITSSLELLRKRVPDDPRVHRLIENALQGAQRGATLTQRMLSFARRQPLRVEPVDLAALVSEMMGLLERSLGPTIVIETSFPEHLAAVRTDPAQLETALLNLAVNARDAMPNGGPLKIAGRAERVTEHSTGSLPPGDYVCLAVTDRGQGMDAETLGRAAEPFFTTKGIGKGTGLGLSMVHGLAEQSGGCLQLDSRPGEGTTVELWLPAAETAPIAAPAPVVAPPAAPQQETGRRCILVVDDDVLVRMNTAAMVEDLGHEVFEAGSGRRALEVLADNPRIDLVMTDHAMPEMTGVELAERIATLRPDLPIILATGYAELPPGVTSELPRLAKPFFQADVAKAIADASARPGPTAFA